ncbi:MAG: glycoside hydrolase family 57 protein [Candidatus Woesearchaeota archaeon]
MVSTCFYFQVHQPYRLKNYKVFDIGKNHDYFDHKKNKEICEKVAGKCYIPANKLMLRLIDRFSKEKHINNNKQFKISYSISGTALEQFEEYTPKVIESFQHLADTGNIEFLNETFHHSLSFLKSKKEFMHQVNLHKRKIKELFGAENARSKVFRNTELIFNNELASFMEEKGFKGIITEGADHILDWRSPNFVYNAKTTSEKPQHKKIKLLLKNYKLSDDIAFRFSNKGWDEWPLTAEKFAGWINKIHGNGEVLNLFMDYETFGEHQWEDTGIFKFMEKLPEELLNSSKNQGDSDQHSKPQNHLVESKHQSNDFVTPSEAIRKYKSKGEIDMHNFVSWADVERDLSAWLGNHMQEAAFNNLHDMEPDMIRISNNISDKDNSKKKAAEKLINDWRRLQTSDHFYYMCTKWFSDGDVHKYFNPYESPYDCFIAFMNIINDLRYRIKVENENQ